MRFVWLLAMALVMTPDYTFAQEPSDCAITHDGWDEATKTASSGCITFAELPPAHLKGARLRNIAALGTSGQKHLPYVLQLLKDEDWDVRVEAAKTLSLMGEASAIPHLMDAIGAHDWKLTFEAMTSLKKLKAGEAEEVLEGIANTYWHPGVAGAARDLLKGDTAPVQSESIVERVMRNLGNRLSDVCEAKIDQASLPRCLDSSDTEGDRDRYNQETQNYRLGFGQAFLAHPALKGAKPLGAVLKIDGGEFIGTDNGEWGGGPRSYVEPRLPL